MLWDGRFDVWQIEFDAGGNHSGAGFRSERALGELYAWPNGCIDTAVARVASDLDPTGEHAEVDSDDAILAYAVAFGERLGSLASEG